MNAPHIIVAMDLPSADQIETTLSRMPDSLSWYKVGLELFCSGGPDVLTPFRTRNKQVFLDLKLP